MLVGQEVIKFQNMEYRKSKLGVRHLGTLVILETGIAFFKAKGALAAGMGFGLVGQFLSRNNEKKSLK